MMRTGTFIISGILLTVTGFYIFGALNFGATFNSQDVGPGYFPVGVGIITIFLSFISLIQVVIGRTGNLPVDLTSFVPDVLPLILISILYGAGILFVGYFTSTGAYIVLAIYLIYKLDLKIALTTAVIFIIFIYILFITLLRVNFPTGYLV